MAGNNVCYSLLKILTHVILYVSCESHAEDLNPFKMCYVFSSQEYKLSLVIVLTDSKITQFHFTLNPYVS